MKESHAKQLHGDQLEMVQYCSTIRQTPTGDSKYYKL